MTSGTACPSTQQPPSHPSWFEHVNTASAFRSTSLYPPHIAHRRNWVHKARGCVVRNMRISRYCCQCQRERERPKYIVVNGDVFPKKHCLGHHNTNLQLPTQRLLAANRWPACGTSVTHVSTAVVLPTSYRQRAPGGLTGASHSLSCVPAAMLLAMESVNDTDGCAKSRAPMNAMKAGDIHLDAQQRGSRPSWVRRPHQYAATEEERKQVCEAYLQTISEEVCVERERETPREREKGSRRHLPETTAAVHTLTNFSNVFMQLLNCE